MRFQLNLYCFYHVQVNLTMNQVKLFWFIGVSLFLVLWARYFNNNNNISCHPGGGLFYIYFIHFLFSRLFLYDLILYILCT